MLLLSVLLFCSVVQAAVSVKVYSLDESMSAVNQSTPRIYIQNTGTETINNFAYRYYFSTENSLVPALEDFYTPDCQIMLVPVSSTSYYVQYSITGANLPPGGLLPHSSGNSIGLHYGNWGAWDKTNDFSNLRNSSFLENNNIAVYIGGTRIYGNEPSSTSGSVLREVWTGITGTSVDNIPLTTTPQITGSQSNLDAPRNFNDNYGVRLRGYITAPSSGSYIFWIASDDNSQFMLSTNDQPASKVLLASVTGYTTDAEWFKYTTQKSSPVTLTAGSRYYFEVLHKDGTQNDLCIVKWTKPGENTNQPTEVVPSTVLTPFVPAVLPAAPTGLTATAISSQRIDLSWTDASNNEFGFTIEKEVASGVFSEIAMVAANQTSYQLTGLTAETLYRFRVKAYNATGTSAYSAVAQAVTHAVPAGSVTRELWAGAPGWSVSDIPLSLPPTSITSLTTLETPSQAGDYYGQRIRGYIIPPTTGQYTFWLASDDKSQLFLSTNDQATSKVSIASVASYTGEHVWNAQSTQKSAPISLTAGLRYYVEVLHKEGNQNDNLAVWWSKPGESTSNPSGPLPASVLSPFIIPSIPAAPANLVATPLSATQIDLAWADNSNNEDGFRIERSNGGSPFVEIGITAPNATIFHDAGLTATTQYQYRIRSFNGLGNSVTYSNTANAITLESVPSLASPVELLSFAVYSSEKTTLSSRSLFNGGGAVGSNKYVEIHSQAVVNGNVLSGDSIVLKPQAVVNGTVSAAGKVTLEAGASADEIIEGAAVSIISIPEKTVPVSGTEDDAIASGENRQLAPGCYRNFVVNTGGILTLTAGQYTFASLFLQPDAKILLDVAMADMIEIDIAGDLEFSDRSSVVFKENGYVPFIRFYTNDVNTVRIGCNVSLNGTLIAPHANIAMFSHAQCNGALYGKTITVEPDAIIISDMTNPEKDSDGDGIQNVLEILMGTKTDDASSFIPIAIPSRAWIDNAGSEPVTITYDYTRYFSNEFPTSKAVAVTYKPEDFIKSFIPPIVTLVNEPEEGEHFDESGYEVRGRYLQFAAINSVKPDRTIRFRFPIVKRIAGWKPAWYALKDLVSGWNLVKQPSKADDGDILGEAPDESEEVDLTGNGPFAQVDPIKVTNTTLYYDNGVVFTRSNQNRLHYSLKVLANPNEGSEVTLTVYYTNLSTNQQESFSVPLEYSEVMEGGAKKCYYEESGVREFGEIPVQITKCRIDLERANGTSNWCEKICSDYYTISGGKTMQLVFSSVTGAFSYPADLSNSIVLYFAQDFEFESASFGEGRILSAANGGIPSQPYTYEYFLTDHLGSTRMVVNDQEQVAQALMYQPYGKIEEIGSPAAGLDVREKFTTKEFDEDGAPMGKLEFEMVFNLGADDAVDLDKTKWNAIGVYYTDILTPRAEAVGDIIMLEVDEATNTAVAKASITYTEGKQIKWIGIVLNGADLESENPIFDINCAITPINEDVGTNSRLTIHKTVENSSELLEVLPKTYLTYVESGCDLVGIGQYYFGARYYDPELGVWGSTDPKQQYWSPYKYGSNPVSYVDPDGMWMKDVLAWIGEHNTFSLGMKLNAYLYAGYQSLANDKDFGSSYTDAMALQTVIAGSAIAGGVAAAATGMATVGTIVSSTANSAGMWAYNEGHGDITTSFGFGTMNWSDGDFSFTNPFDSDPWYQNAIELGGWYGFAADTYAGGASIYDQIEKMRLGSAYDVIKDIRDVNSSPWYGNYLGPGANSPSGHLGKFVDPINKLDDAAREHDIMYRNLGASGIDGALRNPNVIGADYMLAGKMAMSLGSKLTTSISGYNVIENNIGYVWAFVGSVAFTGLGTGKNLMVFNQYYNWVKPCF